MWKIIRCTQKLLIVKNCFKHFPSSSEKNLGKENDAYILPRFDVDVIPKVFCECRLTNLFWVLAQIMTRTLSRFQKKFLINFPHKFPFCTHQPALPLIIGQMEGAESSVYYPRIQIHPYSTVIPTCPINKCF